MSGHLVLASGSPRRLTLLRDAGFDPEVRIPPVDETPLAGEDPSAMVQRLALAKLHSVVVAGETGLAADTAVVIDGEVLGKPHVPDRAEEML
ncbi:MAG: Maf family protein, partial [Acidimicrobiales bacterium]|nr:Maf family protein [Acidimicrobiales bacterium]